jgi:hypothetical protein
MFVWNRLLSTSGVQRATFVFRYGHGFSAPGQHSAFRHVYQRDESHGASATAANHGALSPVPCIPVATGPWQPGSPNDLVNGVPGLTMTSRCMCAYGGMITIVTPGQ